MTFVSHYQSPLGGITVAADGASLTGLWFDGQRHFDTAAVAAAEERALPLFAEVRRWLDLYFAGVEPPFTPPLCLAGSPFRRRVWEQLLRVPYGATTTYGALARLLVREGVMEHPSAQAVGGAVGHNPVALIVPCHRVVAAGGGWGGYAAGLGRKQALLRLEGLAAASRPPAAPQTWGGLCV